MRRGRQRLSTGAVPTALYTVEDLLLQLFPLLLLLRQALLWWIGFACAIVEDFAVLGVPQVCIQAAWGAEEAMMVTPLCHFSLAGIKQQWINIRKQKNAHNVH